MATVKLIQCILLCVFLLLAPLSAYPYNVHHFTSDMKIAQALKLLQDNNGTEILDNLQVTSAKILFYDLALLSYKYMYYYAINGESNFGQRYILINTRYKNCTIEELACLIAHESCHKGKVCTTSEEKLAIQTEAKYWIRLKQSKKVYKDNDLKRRLDKFARIYGKTKK